jgi:hypothetical protein
LCSPVEQALITVLCGGHAVIAKTKPVETMGIDKSLSGRQAATAQGDT